MLALHRREVAKSPAEGPGTSGFEYAESQNRTGDTRFFRPVLYQLSYLGKSMLVRVVIGFARLLAS